MGEIIKKIKELINNIDYGRIEIVIYQGRVKYINHKVKDKIK